MTKLVEWTSQLNESVKSDRCLSGEWTQGVSGVAINLNGLLIKRSTNTGLWEVRSFPRSRVSAPCPFVRNPLGYGIIPAALPWWAPELRLLPMPYYEDPSLSRRLGRRGLKIAMHYYDLYYARVRKYVHVCTCGRIHRHIRNSVTEKTGVYTARYWADCCCFKTP